MIDSDNMEKAMGYLAQTDYSYAEAKTNLLRSEILCKRVRARHYLTAEGGNVEARKAAVEGAQDVIDADEALIAATLAYEQLRARRQRAEIVIQVYRTLEASRRATT